MYGSNDNFLVLKFLLTIPSARRKKASSLGEQNAVTLVQLVIFHACIEVQKPKFCL